MALAGSPGPDALLGWRQLFPNEQATDGHRPELQWSGHSLDGKTATAPFS